MLLPHPEGACALPQFVSSVRANPSHLEQEFPAERRELDFLEDDNPFKYSTSEEPQQWSQQTAPALPPAWERGGSCPLREPS